MGGYRCKVLGGDYRESQVSLPMSPCRDRPGFTRVPGVMGPGVLDDEESFSYHGVWFLLRGPCVSVIRSRL